VAKATFPVAVAYTKVADQKGKCGLAYEALDLVTKVRKPFRAGKRTKAFAENTLPQFGNPCRAILKLL
jgi:hypothetical protein